MHTAVPMTADARNLRVGIAVSRYHHRVTDGLLTGATTAFREAGGVDADLVVVDAPGAFELVALARALAMRTDMDAVVCLGCVLTGETTHDRHIATAVAVGIEQASRQRGVPITFGVLTCETPEQALARAGGAQGNKGVEAAEATLAMMRLMPNLAATSASTPG